MVQSRVQDIPLSLKEFAVFQAVLSRKRMPLAMLLLGFLDTARLARANSSQMLHETAPCQEWGKTAT